MKFDPELALIHDSMQKHSAPARPVDWAYRCEWCGAWVVKSKNGPGIHMVKPENIAASIGELAKIPGLKLNGKDNITGDVTCAEKVGYKTVNSVLLCLNLIIKNRFLEDIEVLITQLRHLGWDNTPARKCLLNKAPARLRKLRREHAKRQAQVKQSAGKPTSTTTKA